MNKNSLYLTLKTAALAAVLAEYISTNTLDGITTVGALAFCCLFLTDFLINRLCKTKKAGLICAPLGILGCFMGGAVYFPLLLMQLFELADIIGLGEYYYSVSAVGALFTALAIQPDSFALTTAAILTAAGAFARMAVERVEYFRELSEKQRGTIAAQNERIAKLRSWSETLRESVALEERSRFSARIHDKLGHGISGSIILLEGAKLNLGKDPEQTEKSLDTVIENLRVSVDSIRAALREERPKRGTASAAELREMLERFSVNYDIKTAFSLDGDADRIPAAMWNCLKENLTEALTNTIKHSNANEFTLKIRVFDKLIRAEFADNGCCADGFTSGMGLDGIEDRTAACGGKCLFQCGMTGFKIINIFGVNNDKGFDS
ncbi:MAG: hypothetical protein K2N38_04305 [Oscillospiraceae bacterium]|nr:hypothetical protein [Oscillospiraceae bacterium]